MPDQNHESDDDEAADLDPSAELTPGTFLTLGHILAGIGAEQSPPIGLEDIHLVRHSFNTGDDEGLQGREDLTQERVREYTRFQGISARQFPADPARYWVILIADGQRRSRLYGTYENFGEVVAERTATRRYFDLRPSSFLAPLADRLVVEWGNPRTWHRRATSAAKLPVLEIADRDTVPFPGFDRVLLTHHELGEMVSDHRYADWRAALSEVQGIYLITNSSNGKQYVGKADGAERILGRWMSYARDGHGGNIALRELAFASLGSHGAKVKTDHARNFLFSILRVFGPSTSSTEVDAAESHYKRALMTREFGLNRN
ncbi:GIY-YIG nuclease family protein [Mycobacterium sp. CVI_P3]|uniref:GIY-YIG nuclease family protein n=1 Tax=Mycobacterium pinniadriaticum TaxID=2994102 RepID=A0ABT3SNI5_9MYCO|nr:GIY-YIG nuclease family protein [Mycobacterium pinniadriaticum]MCX2934661.1 GIY-YIG nuclease family protein [Mycobacterium pinniadriaticum]MCX2941084.1 GIY-YIG nuclease family protein [Mycobacterium pinniadriaticum]